MWEEDTKKERMYLNGFNGRKAIITHRAGYVQTQRNGTKKTKV
jgi:hypothetical protein